NHHSLFSAQQGFRVEIRALDERCGEVLFSTQQGDPLLQPWSEHSFDLHHYRGERIRIAFVEEHVFVPTFNAHLDSVSVRLHPATPVLFDVYLGTSPTLGPADLLGSTDTPSWNLPILAPLTTYYWQVRSRRLGVTPGPVWSFTTRGVSYFSVGS